MSSRESPAQPLQASAPPRPPRIWKFWGTSLWGLVVFAAMFAGQMLVVGYFVLSKGASADLDLVKTVLSSGLAISTSVIMGLPAVLATLWLATRMARVPFADYLALRWTSWRNLLLGVVALGVLVMGWDLLSRALGREVAPGFMGDVLKSARADGALWLLLLAFCVVAPATEEFFARGFLYRGWSESSLRPFGAVVLSSLVWTAMHLQYDLFFLGEVFSIGLLLGYLRYRSGSTWLTAVVHGINNFAATAQSIWLAGS
jgi:membrane protease YdiL (CAAX protease family)